MIDGTQDEVRGFVLIGAACFRRRARATESGGSVTLVREVKRVPGSKNVLAALSEMRREGH